MERLRHCRRRSTFFFETHQQGVGGWTAAPPLVRLLWRLKLDVPPPLYWSFAANALTLGLMLGLLFWLFTFLIRDGGWGRGLITTSIAAVFFGWGMASYTRKLARRLRLSPWDGRQAGGDS